jgi:hypothetical protein
LYKAMIIAKLKERLKGAFRSIWRKIGRQAVLQSDDSVVLIPTLRSVRSILAESQGRTKQLHRKLS